VALIFGALDGSARNLGCWVKGKYKKKKGEKEKEKKKNKIKK